MPPYINKIDFLYELFTKKNENDDDIIDKILRSEEQITPEQKLYFLAKYDDKDSKKGLDRSAKKVSLLKNIYGNKEFIEQTGNIVKVTDEFIHNLKLFTDIATADKRSPTDVNLFSSPTGARGAVNYVRDRNSALKSSYGEGADDMNVADKVYKEKRVSHYLDTLLKFFIQVNPTTLKMGDKCLFFDIDKVLDNTAGSNDKLRVFTIKEITKASNIAQSITDKNDGIYTSEMINKIIKYPQVIIFKGADHIETLLKQLIDDTEDSNKMIEVSEAIGKYKEATAAPVTSITEKDMEEKIRSETSRVKELMDKVRLLIKETDTLTSSGDIAKKNAMIEKFQKFKDNEYETSRLDTITLYKQALTLKNNITPAKFSEFNNQISKLSIQFTNILNNLIAEIETKHEKFKTSAIDAANLKIKELIASDKTINPWKLKRLNNIKLNSNLSKVDDNAPNGFNDAMKERKRAVEDYQNYIRNQGRDIKIFNIYDIVFVIKSKVNTTGLVIDYNYDSSLYTILFNEELSDGKFTLTEFPSKDIVMHRETIDFLAYAPIDNFNPVKLFLSKNLENELIPQNVQDAAAKAAAKAAAGPAAARLSTQPVVYNARRPQQGQDGQPVLLDDQMSDSQSQLEAVMRQAQEAEEAEAEAEEADNMRLSPRSTPGSPRSTLNPVVPQLPILRIQAAEDETGPSSRLSPREVDEESEDGDQDDEESEDGDGGEDGGEDEEGKDIPELSDFSELNEIVKKIRKSHGFGGIFRSSEQREIKDKLDKLIKETAGGIVSNTSFDKENTDYKKLRASVEEYEDYLKELKAVKKKIPDDTYASIDSKIQTEIEGYITRYEKDFEKKFEILKFRIEHPQTDWKWGATETPRAAGGTRRGGKIFNKKTFKNKIVHKNQFKKKQTHKNQFKGKQTHKNQLKRKQTHKNQFKRKQTHKK
jgi:hypothetical protein